MYVTVTGPVVLAGALAVAPPHALASNAAADPPPVVAMKRLRLTVPVYLFMLCCSFRRLEAPTAVPA